MHRSTLLLVAGLLLVCVATVVFVAQGARPGDMPGSGPAIPGDEAGPTGTAPVSGGAAAGDLSTASPPVPAAARPSPAEAAEPPADGPLPRAASASPGEPEAVLAPDVVARTEQLRALYPGMLANAEDFAELMREADAFGDQLERLFESYLEGLTPEEQQAEIQRLLRGEGELMALFGEFVEEWSDGALGPDSMALTGSMLGAMLAGEAIDDLSALVARAALESGDDTAELMLHVGLVSNQLGAAEILELVRATGTGLPPLTAGQLALGGRVEDLRLLAEQGQFSYIGEREPISGHNAIGSFVIGLGGQSRAPVEPAQAVEQLATLIELGIDTRQAGGEVDLVSFMLDRMTPQNSGLLMPMAAYMVQSGHISSPQELTVWADSTPAQRQQLVEMFERLRATPLSSPARP